MAMPVYGSVGICRQFYEIGWILIGPCSLSRTLAVTPDVFDRFISTISMRCRSFSSRQNILVWKVNYQFLVLALNVASKNIIAFNEWSILARSFRSKIMLKIWWREWRSSPCWRYTSSLDVLNHLFLIRENEITETDTKMATKTLSNFIF